MVWLNGRRRASCGERRLISTKSYQSASDNFSSVSGRHAFGPFTDPQIVRPFVDLKNKASSKGLPRIVDRTHQNGPPKDRIISPGRDTDLSIKLIYIRDSSLVSLQVSQIAVMSEHFGRTRVGIPNQREVGSGIVTSSIIQTELVDVPAMVARS